MHICEVFLSWKCTQILTYDTINGGGGGGYQDHLISAFHIILPISSIFTP